MKVGVFSCKTYDRPFLEAQNQNYGFDMDYMECALSPETVAVAKPYDAISVFVDDIVDSSVLDTLASFGISHIALRCPGFNNLDLAYAKKLNIGVSRVPSYSTSSVAEHTVALILALDRKLHRTYNRVLENNYSLEGLLGFNLEYKTVGVVGTGRIGTALIKILTGFGCRIVCFDPTPTDDARKLGVTYTDLDTLFSESDIVSLHCPLTEFSKHIIDHGAIQKMKDGVMLINTCEGGLINVKALLAGLKSQKIGYFGMDIYDMQSALIPVDELSEPTTMETCERLNTFPNVLITGHQGFFTQESMQHITEVTLRNLQYFFAGKIDDNTFL